MKKLIAPIITSFLILFLFINCSTDDIVQIDQEKLLGVWYNNFLIEESNQTSKLEYSFKEDGSFELLREGIDNISGESLGYVFRESGSFKLEGNMLIFSNVKSYSSDIYTTIENLQFIDGIATFSVTIELKNEDKILTFTYPPCGPNENCIGSQTFERE